MFSKKRFSHLWIFDFVAKPTKPVTRTPFASPFVSFVNWRQTVSTSFAPFFPHLHSDLQKGTSQFVCSLRTVPCQRASPSPSLCCVIPNASLHTNQLKPQSGSKLYRCPDCTPTCFKLLTALIPAPFPPIYNISTAHRQVQPTRRSRDVQHPTMAATASVTATAAASPTASALPVLTAAVVILLVVVWLRRRSSSSSAKTTRRTAAAATTTKVRPTYYIGCASWTLCFLAAMHRLI